MMTTVTFIVINSPFVYNTIIGPVTQHTIRAVANTYHVLFKFPTPNGIGIIDGAQTLGQEMYRIATRSSQNSYE